MDAKLIELLTDITEQANNVKWLSILLIVCVIVMGVWLHSRVKGYGEKLGEIEAETAKLPEIKEQLRATTQVTESIKSEFSQKEWTARERSVLMRTKLEEAVTAAFAVYEAMNQQTDTIRETELEGDADKPRNRLHALVQLYFDQLEGPAKEVRLASFELSKAVSLVHTKWKLYEISVNGNLPAEKIAAAKKEYREAHDAGDVEKQFQRLMNGVYAFAAACRTEMQQYLPGADSPAKVEAQKASAG